MGGLCMAVFLKCNQVQQILLPHWCGACAPLCTSSIPSSRAESTGRAKVCTGAHISICCQVDVKFSSLSAQLSTQLVSKEELLRNFTERLLLHDAFLWALLSVGWILSSAHATQTYNKVLATALRYFTATYVCFMILVETIEDGGSA